MFTQVIRMYTQAYVTIVRRNNFQHDPFPDNLGGVHLVYFPDGDVPFFRVSFLPIFTGTGYQKKEIFLEPVVKTCQKGEFC